MSDTNKHVWKHARLPFYGCSTQMIINCCLILLHCTPAYHYYYDNNKPQLIPNIVYAKLAARSHVKRLICMETISFPRVLLAIGRDFRPLIVDRQKGFNRAKQISVIGFGFFRPVLFFRTPLRNKSISKVPLLVLNDDSDHGI